MKKQWIIFFLVLMCLSKSTQSIACDELLEQCSLVVQKARIAVIEQQQVIEAQDQIIQTQKEIINSESKKSKEKVSVLSWIASTLLLLVIL